MCSVDRERLSHFRVVQPATHRPPMAAVNSRALRRTGSARSANAPVTTASRACGLVRISAASSIPVATGPLLASVAEGAKLEPNSGPQYTMTPSAATPVDRRILPTRGRTARTWVHPGMNRVPAGAGQARTQLGATISVLGIRPASAMGR